MKQDDRTFIMTAKLDAQSQAWLDDLRNRHFPKDRNFLKAHLTIFHRVLPLQTNRLEAIALPENPMPVSFSSLRLLGYGVAVNVECPPLLELRERLARELGTEMTRQDQQKFRPHITVQNKVEPNVARELYDQLCAEFVRRDGYITGLKFWTYLGGPWSPASERSFGSLAESV